MNLKEIYESGRDIKDDEIPDFWKPSFYKFMRDMFYSNNSTDEVISKYYSTNFRMWYVMNSVAIERDIKLNNIIDI